MLAVLFCKSVGGHRYAVARSPPCISAPVNVCLRQWGLRKKEYIDFALRLVGLAAIFIPIVLFLAQQKNEFQRQKRLFEIEAYTSTATNIQVMLNKSLDNKEFSTAKDELYYKCYPKIKFINDSSIIHKLDTIKTYLDLYSILFQKHKDLDIEIYEDEYKKYPAKITSDPGEKYFKTTEDFFLLARNNKISPTPKDSNFRSAVILMMESFEYDCNLEADGDKNEYIFCLMEKQTKLLAKRKLIHADLLKLSLELDSLITFKLNLEKK